MLLQVSMRSDYIASLAESEIKFFYIQILWPLQKSPAEEYCNLEHLWPLQQEM